MGKYIKVSGAWREIDDVSIKVSSAWKEVTRVYVKIGVAWKEAWSNYVVTLTGATISEVPIGRAWLVLRSDGTTDEETGGGPTTTQINASTDWIIPNAIAATGDFEAMWTAVGDAPNDVTAGWTTGVYADLTSDLKVGYITGVNETLSADVTVTIRRKTGSLVLDTGVYAISATNVTV